MAKYFITGAEGFIGSHVVESLVSKGHQVVALVLYNPFNNTGWLNSLPKNIINSVEIKFGDVRDPDQMNKIISRCDRVIHLAAMISVPYSYEAPSTFISTNVMGTLNILQSAKSNNNIEKIVITSTSEVYGSAKTVPINEQHELNAQSPYAASKTGADQLALSFFHSYKLPITIVRPFNTYGPRQSPRAVLPTIITQILNRFERIKLGSLYTTRDFSYVTDTAEGLIASSIPNVVIGEVLNLGSNFEISISDCIEIISEIIGYKPHITLDNKRTRPESSEVLRLWSDNSRACKMLDWKPKHASLSGFKSGLEKTISWFSKSENMKLYDPYQYSI
ncbi:SDR family NAD(P)-dependent oxidoreductase [Alphaproteobacteria bacterium]|nr:SDR family NAD(P)-dependent oxidoreductase [Alphaproteobacteria bacterium]